MKKIIAALLTAAMLVGGLSLVSSAQSYRHDNTFVLGDVNGDSDVNAKDCLALKCVIARVDGYTINEAAADINADGAATSRDSLLLKASCAKQIDISTLDTTDSIYKLTIAGTDISEYCIVVPEGSTEAENVHFAAEQLVKYIKEAYKVELNLCNGEANATNDKMIVFHSLLNTDDPLEDTLGFDGYKYTVVNGRMDIYGGMRGNMYAVYDIAEKYFGFRFYSAEETFVMKSRTVDFAEGTSTQYIPKLTFRFCGQTFGSKTAEAFYFPRKLNGTQIYSYESEYRHGTLTGPHFINAHSFEYYYTMGWGTYTDDDHLKDTYDDGIEKVAEWNRTHDASKQINGSTWQPCGTATDTYEQLFEGMLRTIRYIHTWGDGHLFRETNAMMSFSINDNLKRCNCRACNNVVATEGMSGLYVNLTNRAARDVKAYYPELRLYTIIYDHTIPQNVRPESNVVIMYCGNGCNQHALGTHGCGDNVTTNVFGFANQRSNKYDEEALIAWGQFCKDAGAEMWFWEYPVTYAYYLTGCPNIFNIYYDYQYLYKYCNVTGIYYEGGGKLYNFESLKAYMSSLLEYDTEMTFDEYVAKMKEYLYMYYGKGAEEIYQYICMQDEAGNESGSCFVNNWDRPGEMYSAEYIGEHYEEMRALLVTALGKTVTDAQTERIKTLIICCDFLGMSAVYDDMYTNGTAESRATYIERYDAMWNRINDLGMELFCTEGVYPLKAKNYDVNPMIWFYEFATRRDIDVPWGTLNEFEARRDAGLDY